jgi:hypothetical protein
MATDQSEIKAGIKIKKKGHPMGKLGIHVKKGMSITYNDFFRVADRAFTLARIGEGSIRP